MYVSILEYTVTASIMWGNDEIDAFIPHQLGVQIPLNTHLVPREGEPHLQASHPHSGYRDQDSGTQEGNTKYCIHRKEVYVVY